MKRIGERIKKKRETLQMTLNGVAEKVGISPSALSQIEKSKSFPSILTLKSIADALRTTIGDLVGENDILPSNPVVLKKEIKFVDQNPSGTIVFSLNSPDPTRQMDSFLVRLAQASGTEGLFPNTHGQVFCHVLSGEIRFDLDETSYILKPGDNIYFNAKHPYNAINNTNGVSELLWVQTPPGF